MKGNMFDQVVNSGTKKSNGKLKTFTEIVYEQLSKVWKWYFVMYYCFVQYNLNKNLWKKNT